GRRSQAAAHRQRGEGPERVGHRRRADDRRAGLLPQDALAGGGRGVRRVAQQGAGVGEDRRAAGQDGTGDL
ncbi:MAG: hypothetical protein AVDCRST_MAG13-312, partial [uncultured Solirubrobacteraceae bacterium]